VALDERKQRAPRPRLPTERHRRNARRIRTRAAQGGRHQDWPLGGGADATAL